jgi:hypothetical protein
MGNTDSLPVISQLKSAVQAMSGDLEGAKRTQENFSQQAPVVSQVTSIVQAASGDAEGARRTQEAFGNGVKDFSEGVPVVGHVIGVGYYIAGDTAEGDKAMKASSRTVGVVAGGVGGFMAGGPVGAFAGGVAGGAAMDGIITGVDSAVHHETRPSGNIEVISNMAEGKSTSISGDVFDVVAGVTFDGLGGLSAGELAGRAGGVRFSSTPELEGVLARAGEAGPAELASSVAEEFRALTPEDVRDMHRGALLDMQEVEARYAAEMDPVQARLNSLETELQNIYKAKDRLWEELKSNQSPLEEEKTEAKQAEDAPKPKTKGMKPRRKWTEAETAKAKAKPNWKKDDAEAKRVITRRMAIKERMQELDESETQIYPKRRLEQDAKNAIQERIDAERGFKGKLNIHELNELRAGQVAADLKPQPIGARRVAERVIVSTARNYRFNFLEYVSDHDYSRMQSSAASRFLTNNPLVKLADQSNTTLYVLYATTQRGTGQFQQQQQQPAVFEFSQGLDSPGNDIARLEGLSAEQLKQKTLQLGGVAFNTDGYVKARLTPRDQWTASHSSEPTQGLYFLAQPPVAPVLRKPEWVFSQGRDSPGSDITRLEGLTVEELERKCLELGGVAFNTDGYIKSRVLPKDQWTAWNAGVPDKGLYLAQGKVPPIGADVAVAREHLLRQWSQSPTWQIHQGLDSPGSDIMQVPGLSVEELKEKCLEVGGVGFAASASGGWIKAALNPPEQWTKSVDPGQDLYTLEGVHSQYWTLHRQVDSPSNDLGHFPDLSVEQLKQKCIDLGGVAFTLNHFIKGALLPQDHWTKAGDDMGIYVLSSVDLLTGRKDNRTVCVGLQDADIVPMLESDILAAVSAKTKAQIRVDPVHRTLTFQGTDEQIMAAMHLGLWYLSTGPQQAVQLGPQTTGLFDAPTLAKIAADTGAKITKDEAQQALIVDGSASQMWDAKVRIQDILARQQGVHFDFPDEVKGLMGQQEQKQELIGQLKAAGADSVVEENGGVRVKGSPKALLAAAQLVQDWVSTIQGSKVLMKQATIDSLDEDDLQGSPGGPKATAVAVSVDAAAQTVTLKGTKSAVHDAKLKIVQHVLDQEGIKILCGDAYDIFDDHNLLVIQIECDCFVTPLPEEKALLLKGPLAEVIKARHFVEYLMGIAGETMNYDPASGTHSLYCPCGGTIAFWGLGAEINDQPAECNRCGIVVPIRAFYTCSGSRAETVTFTGREDRLYFGLEVPDNCYRMVNIGVEVRLHGAAGTGAPPADSSSSSWAVAKPYYLPTGDLPAPKQQAQSKEVYHTVLRDSSSKTFSCTLLATDDEPFMDQFVPGTAVGIFPRNSGLYWATAVDSVTITATYQPFKMAVVSTKASLVPWGDEQNDLYFVAMMPRDLDKLERVVIRVESHDQGTAGGRPSDAYSWGEMSVYPQCPPRQTIFRNKPASGTDWQRHTFVLNKTDPLAQALTASSSIGIYARSQSPGWRTWLNSALVEIHYVPSQ